MTDIPPLKSSPAQRRAYKNYDDSRDDKAVSARLSREILERIEQVRGGQARSAFIREAVIKEIERRESDES